ncbi:MAG: PQQ-binding-like beta-propeller repeat protein [Ferruginibacter sp.]|nr:PQQ-binding-like beta-propeller repeat protein [Cytophagales bacterium]
MKSNLASIALRLVLLVSLLQSCGKKDEPAPAGPNAPNNPAPAVPQQLAGNPALNRFILTSKDEEITRVDPATGKHETIFSFEKYADVASIDYLNGVMYAGAEDNSVNAIDLQSKKLLWDIPLIEYDLTTTSNQKAVVKEGVCYAVGYAGVLVAADIATGKPLWAYPLDPTGRTDGYFPTSQITVTADKIIIGSTQTVFYEGERNYVYVLNRATGKLIWRKALPKDKWVSGAIRLAGNTLLVPANNLYALDINAGNVLWEVALQYSNSGRGVGSPVVAGDRVLVHGAVGIIDGRLVCLDLPTGRKIWEIDAGTDYVGRYAPLVVGNFVFGVHERGVSSSWNGRPFLADIATGQLIWANDDVSMDTSPVYANGRLYFHGQTFKGGGSTDDRVGLLSLEAATGKFLWVNNYFRYGSSVTPIVIADNGTFRPGYYAVE